MYALKCLLFGLFLSSLLGCSSVVSVAHEPADVAVADLAVLDASLPPEDRPPPVDIAPRVDIAPLVDIAPRVDRADVTAPDVTAPDVVEADGPVSTEGAVLVITTEPEGPDLYGGVIVLYESGQWATQTCGGLTGACTNARGPLMGGVMGVATLRAETEATGFLDSPQGVFPPSATRRLLTFTWFRAGLRYEWAVDDVGVFPMPVVRAFQIVAKTLNHSIPMS